MLVISLAKRKVSADILFATILVFTLLPGCQAAPIKPAAPAPVTSAICNSDTDTFCVEGDQDRAARLNRQGLEYAAKKDYDKALDLFNQAIAVDNSNPQFHYNLGVTYSYKGMVEEEEAAYLNVLSIEPDDPKANPVLANTYFNLACLYALQGKKDPAFSNLEKLLTVDSKTLYHYLQEDEDLKSLREDPRFKQLVARQFGDSFKFKEDHKSVDTSKPEESKKKKSVKPAPSEVPAK